MYKTGEFHKLFTTFASVLYQIYNTAAYVVNSTKKIMENFDHHNYDHDWMAEKISGPNNKKTARL